MSRPLSIGLLAIALAGGLVLLLRPREASTAALLVAESAPAPAASAPAEEAAPSRDLLDEHEEARVPEVAQPPALPVSEMAHATVSTAAVLRGRLLLDGGAPAVGAALQVNGWQANTERELEFGEPEHWEDPSGTTKPDGRFELAFDPPRAYQFTLDATYPGCAAASWRWGQILPGSTVDVGDVVLLRAGTIVGKIVDGSGNPVPGQWVVYGDGVPSQLSEDRDDRDETRAHAVVDPTTAAFRLEGVPPGAVHLKAHGRNVGWIDGPTVDVRSGEEIEALLRYEGLDPSRRLTVTVFSEPFYIFDVDASAIRLLRDGVEVARSKKVERSSQSFAFEDLDPGEYEVVIEDEKFEPWSRSGLHPGKEVQAQLAGNAAILLDVRDAASGERVPRYQLDVAFLFPDGHSVSPNVFRIQELDEEPPADGAYEGLIPHDCEFLVKAAGYAMAKVPVDGMAPNERRTLVAELERGRTITALVLQPNGKPVEGVAVELHHGSVDERVLTDFQREKKEGKPLEAKTNAAGIASFDGLGRGVWTLVAMAGGDVRAQAQVEIAAGELAPVELRLPMLAYLSGQVVGPERLRWHGWEIVADPVRDESETQLMDFRNSSSNAELDENGRFRIGPLAPEDWIVTLVLPNGGNVRVCFADPGTIELERLTITGGEELEREYELGSRAPGSLQVAVTTNSAPAGGVLVTLHRLDEEGMLEDPPVAFGITESGVAQLDIVPPGSWSLVARDIESRWVWGSPTPIAIGPDAQERTSIAFELVSGRLEVHELGTGEPLECRMRWTCNAGGFVVSGRLEADSQGIVEAVLPPGEYRIAMDRGHSADSVLVNWTSSGPSPAILELPRGRR